MGVAILPPSSLLSAHLDFARLIKIVDPILERRTAIIKLRGQVLAPQRPPMLRPSWVVTGRSHRPTSAISGAADRLVASRQLGNHLVERRPIAMRRCTLAPTCGFDATRARMKGDDAPGAIKDTPAARSARHSL